MRRVGRPGSVLSGARAAGMVLSRGQAARALVAGVGLVAAGIAAI